MAYIYVYPNRINWENEPSINTPINDVNLNKIDYAVYQHDQTLGNWDTTKANQSDLLLCVKTIAYDDETGVFTFTWQNGTTSTVDLNIEKIPVSFSMSPEGIITMTTEDGTTYTADIKSLITEYEFADSAQIDFTVKDMSNWYSSDILDIEAYGSAQTLEIDNLSENMMPDSLDISLVTTGSMVIYSNLKITKVAIYYDMGQEEHNYGGSQTSAHIDIEPSGNISYIRKIEVTYALISSSEQGYGIIKVNANYPQTHKQITAIIKDGSITGSKLQPNYLADCTAAKTAAELAETGAEGSAEDAEAWAVGQRNGQDVPSTDPAYQNNSKYWAEHTSSSFAGLTDTNISNPQNGQVAVFNSTSQKWENQDQSGATIDDTATSATKVWSSQKTNTQISSKADNLALTQVNNAQNNKHKVTTIEVDTSSWVQDTTSQSGTTLYKKTISLNNIYANPIVDIGAASGNVLPTTAQQAAYDLLEYVTHDSESYYLYLYASDIPTDTFYINVEGVD